MANDKTIEQLKRYAQDLARVHQAEKKRADELKTANEQLRKYANDLTETIADLKISNEALQKSYVDTIQRLVVAAEFKDEDTGDHIVRMSRYSALLAEKVGFENNHVELILLAAPMHDVGKIGIPDAILMKKGKLTTEEFDVIKTHTTIGGRILENSDALILQWARTIALSHHEKWNGKGYPSGLRGTQIPIIGRICAIADVFDALTSRRPYKEPFSASEAFQIIQEGSGEHFDPNLVNLFLASKHETIEICSAGIGEKNVPGNL